MIKWSWFVFIIFLCFDFLIKILWQRQIRTIDKFEKKNRTLRTTRYFGYFNLYRFPEFVLIVKLIGGPNLKMKPNWFSFLAMIHLYDFWNRKKLKKMSIGHSFGRFIRKNTNFELKIVLFTTKWWLLLFLFLTTWGLKVSFELRFPNLKRRIYKKG